MPARSAISARLPRIGELTNRYDVALLQEDFAHHAQLLQGATHPVVERGNSTRFRLRRLLSFLCGDCGSGLTILERYAPQHVVDVHREAFERCSGWVLYWTGSDCFATKGILSTRLRLPNGAEVDFYNVHMDAGNTRGDQRARRHQLARLQTRIAERTSSQAVVVGGDFNLRSDEPRDVELLSAFREALGLDEAGIDIASGSDDWKRQVDYIFYHSGDGAALQLVSSGVASEFIYGGQSLSDHPAIFARFRVQPPALEAPLEAPEPALAPVQVIDAWGTPDEQVAASPGDDSALAAGAPAETGL